jgi:2,3-bisphosphoglycerate-dependent phosphoglycerate mutase
VDPLELWLVRHGETACSRDGVLAGWTDVPLTANGVAQAEAVRPLLAGERFAGAWSSDLQRTVATAQLAWGAAVADPRLREINFGEFEGRAWATLDPAVRNAIAAFDGFRPERGESFDEAFVRVAGFLDDLPPGRHLVFTHGGVIRLLTRAAGQDGFVPTGTVVGLDWSRRAMLFTRECSIPARQAFAE